MVCPFFLRLFYQAKSLLDLMLAQTLRVVERNAFLEKAPMWKHSTIRR